VLALAPAPAFADPPAPSDYRSEVMGITPSTDRVSAEVVGGDAFLQLRVRPGTRVEVPGYQQEPYLRFDADGRVFENVASPTWYLNRSRLGAPVPPDVTSTTPADWRRVAGNGTYVWHDHRTHWMGSGPPPRAARGDRIIDNTIPISVDGVPHEVRVIATWEPIPSKLPMMLGLLLGSGAAMVVVLSRRRWVARVVAGAAAVAASTVGMVQYRSVPAATGPQVTWWLLPALAAATLVLSAALARRAGWVVADGLVVLAGVQLGLWAWMRRATMTRAVLPTDLWWPLDRFVTAWVLVVGPAIAVTAAWPIASALLRPRRPETPLVGHTGG
jgi:hypothetical protein